MQGTIDPKRLDQVMNWSLKHGSHVANDDGNLCAMEAVAYVAGEPWADEPVCACPVITAFMITWNDTLPTDADRDRVLKPLIPRLVGTRSDSRIEQRRAYMVLDWLMRVQVPTFLELEPVLASYAQALRNLPEIADLPSASAAESIVIRANDAAKVADAAAQVAFAEDATRMDVFNGAGEAALLAARAAAWDAARDTSWAARDNTEEGDVMASAESTGGAAVQAAAVETAWNVVWTAARNAAIDPARAATNDAGAITKGDVMDAAKDAANKALAPTVEWLQSSAVDLVRRMIEVQYGASRIAAFLDWEALDEHAERTVWP